MEERALVFDGLRQLLRKTDFILLFVVFFIGLGLFNAVSTWIEDILRPRGFSITQAGVTGGLMIVGASSERSSCRLSPTASASDGHSSSWR